MKTKAKRVIAGIALTAVVGFGLFWTAGPPVKHPWVQEYVAGQGNIKGNVATARFMSHGEAYAIGADGDGYAVFKNPDAAFSAVKKDYADAIELIRKQYSLPPFSKWTVGSYGTYGWETVAGTKEDHERVQFITSFNDIYENSF